MAGRPIGYVGLRAERTHYLRRERCLRIGSSLETIQGGVEYRIEIARRLTSAPKPKCTDYRTSCICLRTADRRRPSHPDLSRIRKRTARIQSKQSSHGRVKAAWAEILRAKRPSEILSGITG